MPIDRFPERVQPAAYKARAWMMGEGPINIFCGVIALVYALAYYGVFGMDKARVHPLKSFTATDFWATAWLVVSLALFVTAFVECYRCATVALTAWSALMTLWGFQYISTWALDDWDRGPAAGTVHLVGVLVTAWAIWRGSRVEFTIKEDPDATTSDSFT